MPFSYPHRVKREAEEVERKKREEAEAAEKARAEAAKKEKEGAKKALKKERKQLRTLCKDHEFYAKDEEEKLVHMTELEKLCELLQVRKRKLYSYYPFQNWIEHFGISKQRSKI